jgi:hypothetical protein
MNIAVLGTGTVGRTIAGKLTEVGHDVRVGSRSAGDDKVTFADAISHGDVVFNCTSGGGAVEAVTAGEGNLDGKLVIDVTNPLEFAGGVPAMFTDTTDSLAERIQRACPTARVVKSLNTVTAAVMVDPASLPGDHVIFVAGDDAGAKDEARALLGELGWPAERVVDIGDLTAARAAEGYVMLWIRLMQAQGTPMFNIEIKRAG